MELAQYDQSFLIDDLGSFETSELDFAWLESTGRDFRPTGVMSA
jgi:hypothetical protein